MIYSQEVFNMRILYVVHQFFPKWYTGTERFVLNIAKQMQRMGHYVEVLTYGFKDDADFSVHGGGMYKRYTFQNIPVTSVRHLKVPEDISFVFNIFDEGLKGILDRIITKENFDIVHIAHPVRLGYTIKVANSADLPVILTLTDFWLMCPRGIAVTQNEELCKTPENGMKCARVCYGNLWKDKLIQRFNEANEIIKNVDIVTAPTYFLAGVFKNVFNRDIKVIRHGIEYSDVKRNKRLKHERDDIVFGYIGTILPHKGVHIVVEALKSLKSENIKVKIYGNYFHEKEYFENLKKMADGDSRIEFLGEYKDDEMQYIMNDADCLLVPSIWWENSPLTVLTSLAFKVPVITINIGGAAELVKDGVNGFNFEIGNSKSLANVMEKIAENPEVLNKIKDNIIRPPRIEEEAFENEKIYLELIAGKSLRPMSILKDRQKRWNMPAKEINEAAVQAVNQNSLIVNTEIQNIYIAKYGDDFIFDIDKRDEMYTFLVNHPDIKNPIAEYFRSGELMLTNLQEIFEDIGYSFGQINSFLDFACGYGRFTRFLIQKLSHEKITISDIDKNAVDFCKKTLRVNGFYSVDNSERLIHDSKYDVIYVASLFSHLSLRLWGGWLKRLYDMLNEGGILIFSTHGMHCYNLLDDESKKRHEKVEEGFFYLLQSETKRLSVKDYGTTYVTYDYVKKVIRQNNIGIIVAYYPKKLWYFQDIYVIQKDGTKTCTT